MSIFMTKKRIILQFNHIVNYKKGGWTIYEVFCASQKFDNIIFFDGNIHRYDHWIESFRSN